MSWQRAAFTAVDPSTLPALVRRHSSNGDSSRIGWSKWRPRSEPQRAAVQLHFNGRGEIARTMAERPRAEAGNAPTVWIGEFSDYKDFGEVMVLLPYRLRLSVRGVDGRGVAAAR